MIFEPKPRWPGAPQFCNSANRMAFKDKAALSDFRKDIGMSAFSIKREWLCKICGHLHYDGSTPSPAGDSSGTSRSQK